MNVCWKQTGTANGDVPLNLGNTFVAGISTDPLGIQLPMLNSSRRLCACRRTGGAEFSLH